MERPAFRLAPGAGWRVAASLGTLALTAALAATLVATVPSAALAGEPGAKPPSACRTGPDAERGIGHRTWPQVECRVPSAGSVAPEAAPPKAKPEPEGSKEPRFRPPPIVEFGPGARPFGPHVGEFAPGAGDFGPRVGEFGPGASR